MYTTHEEAAGACVTLGVVRSKAKSTAKSGGHVTDHSIGGLPRVFGVDMLQALPVKCGACGAGMPLLCQVHTPIEGLTRVLYVFACDDPDCQADAGGSNWSVVRLSLIHI